MGLDATLKRYMPFIILAMLAIAAYFQAVGIGQVLSATVLGGDEPPGSFPHRRRRPRLHDLDHTTNAAAILARNPFDSITGPLHEELPAPPGAEDGAEPTSRDPYSDPPCATARVVIIASSADPDWSFAILAGADGKSVLRRRGEEIDGQKVYFVGDLRSTEHSHEDEGGVWDRVWLTSTSGRCQAALGAGPQKHAPRPIASAPTNGLKEAMGGRIRQISETSFEVDRSAVEQTIANPGELMKARIFPVRDGDRVVGMRLMGIRQGSLLGSLGMANGDVLTAINGFEMNDPQKMLEAYSKLMKADHLTATVMRAGRPVNIEFHIK